MAQEISFDDLIPATKERAAATPAVSSTASVTSSNEISFDDLLPVESEQPKIPTTSLGSFGAAAGEGAVTARGAIAGARAAMAVTPPILPFVGPFAKPIAGIVGGVGSAILTNYGIKNIYQLADSVFGTNIEATREAQQRQNPIATKSGFIAGGSLNPWMRPMLPKTVAGAAGMGAVGLGVGAGVRAVQGEKVFDPKEMTIDAVTGAFVGPTRLGRQALGLPPESKAPLSREGELPTKPPEGSTPEQKQAYIDKLKTIVSEREAKIPLVETAIKNKETGEIELMGPKHNEQRKLETIDTHDQGFITEDNRFLDRKQAFEQAKRSGQIPEGQNPTDISIGLRSEDLRIAGDKRFAITEEQPAGVPKSSVDLTQKPFDPNELVSRQDFKTAIDNKEFRQGVSLEIDMVEAERSGDIRGIAELKAEDARLTAEIEQLRKNIPDVKFADVNKPTWEELHDYLWGARNVGQAFDRLVSNNIGTPQEQLLAKLLSRSQFIRNANLEFEPNYLLYVDPQGNVKNDAIGLYTGEDIHTVKLGKDGDIQTLLHEAIHAATLRLLIEGNSVAAKKLIQLHKEFLSKHDVEYQIKLKAFKDASPNRILTVKELNDFRKENKAEYGLTNVREFVAEAFTNKEFQNLLASIESKEPGSGVTSNLWEAFKNYVREGLNIPPGKRTAFDDVMDSGITLVEQSKQFSRFDAPSDAYLKGVTSDPSVADFEKYKQNKKTEETKKRAKNIMEDMSEEDYNTLQNDLYTGTPKSIIPSSVKEYFPDWLTDSYGRVGSEDAMSSDRMTNTEREFLAEQIDQGADVWSKEQLQQMKAALEETNKPRSLPSVKGSPDEPPVIDRTKTNPRDVQNEKEFYEIATDIYQKHGEVEAVKFFEGYQEYKKTFLEPISETEKFVGINLRNKAANERIFHNESADMKDLVPDLSRREAIAIAVDRGDLSGLSPTELLVAKNYSELVKNIGDEAVNKGVVKGLIEDYVTHIVNWADAPKGFKEEFLTMLLGTSKNDPTMRGMTTESKFAKERTFKTFENLEVYLEQANQRLEASGSTFRLQLKTKDIAEIYKEYALSMQKAIENKSLVDNLKQIRNVNGVSLIQEITKENPLPQGWVMMDSPQFAGYAVHPDLLPALKFVFDAGPGQLMGALGAISQVTKRLNVTGSFFHAKSLMEVLSSTGIPIWTPLKEAVVLPLVEKAVKGLTGKELELSAITKAVNQYRKGGAGDNVDKWIKEGRLQLESPEDVSKGVLTAAGKFADEMIGKYGPKTRVLEKSLSTVEKYTLGIFDKYTWDYLHTGGKLMVADAFLDKARLNAAKEGRVFDEVASRREISSFVDSSFGGLNWFEIATQTRTKLGKDIAMATYSPAGRRALQIGLFAPDWTISTIRAFTMALPKGFNPTKWHPVEGIKGMRTPTTKQDYARLYQFKTALTYLTLLNGINMIVANRPIWENKDKSRIEFPDGTSMQAMKHAMEPYHWITDPDKTLSNKLGFIPKAAIIGVAGTEYASPQAPKIVPSNVTGISSVDSALGRAKAIGSMALPFQVQAAATAPPGEGVKRAVLGTMGLPVYGGTAEQKKTARAEREKILKANAARYRQKEKEAGR